MPTIPAPIAIIPKRGDEHLVDMPLTPTHIVITPERLNAQLAVMYSSDIKPGEPSLENPAELAQSLAELPEILDKLGLMIATPGDLYLRIVEDHFNPTKSGLSHFFLKVGLLKKMPSDVGKPTVLLLYQKFHELLLLLLKRGIPAPQILALLRDVYPNYAQTINRSLNENAVTSLGILLWDLKGRGIANEDLIALMLSPPSAAVRAVDISEAAAAGAGISPDMGTATHSDSPSPSLELAKEIFEKHLKEQINMASWLPLASYSILKLLTLFPDEEFRKRVVAQILNPTFLKNHQTRKPKELYELLSHLLTINVPAERIIEALRTKTGGHPPEDYMQKLLRNDIRPDNGALPEALNFLMILAKKGDTIRAEILEWLTAAEGALVAGAGAGVEAALTIGTGIFESDFIETYHFVSSDGDNRSATMRTYLALIEGLELDPDHKSTRKKAIYKALINTTLYIGGLTSNLKCLDDHELVFEILQDNISSQAYAFNDNHDLVGALKILSIATRLSALAEISFERLFALVKKIHEARLRFIHEATPHEATSHKAASSYTNGDLELLFLTLINLLKKDSRPANAAKQIVELLSSMAKSVFKNLSYNSHNICEHLSAFFDLLNVLKEQGVSDTKMQELGDSFNYKAFYSDGSFNFQRSLAEIVNKKLRFYGEPSTFQLILKMLSQNHLSNASLATLANYRYEYLSTSDGLVRDFKRLPEDELYANSLKIIIGEGSLAKFFEVNAPLRERKQDFIAVIKAQSSRLLNDIKERKFTDAELLKLAPFKDALVAHIQSSTLTDDEKFSLSLQAHDASTPLGRYFSLIIHGSTGAIATKKVLSEPLTKILKDHIAKVYERLASGALTESQRKGLAFLKEEVASYMKTLAEPQRINAHANALIKETPLGQFFYEPRDKMMGGQTLGFNVTNVTKGSLKAILDELKIYSKESLSQFLKEECRTDQFETLRFFERDLVAHLGETLSDKEFWNNYIGITELSVPLSRYYYVLNHAKTATSVSPIMENLNLMLASKAQLFSEKIESGAITRASFDPKLLKEIQAVFLEAVQGLSDLDCKAKLELALRSSKTLQTFFGDSAPQTAPQKLQEKRSDVQGSPATANAALFSIPAPAAPTAAIAELELTDFRPVAAPRGATSS